MALSKRLFPRVILLATFVVAGLSAGCDVVPDESPENTGLVSARSATVCQTSADCGAETFCTVATGVCNPPPTCAPGQECLAVCYGTCWPSADPPPTPTCDKRTHGAPDDCRLANAWQQDASDDCAQSGVVLRQFAPRDECSGGGMRAVDYVCCAP